MALPSPDLWHERLGAVGHEPEVQAAVEVGDFIEHLAQSGRGEFEITDVLNHYVPGGNLFSRVYDGHWADAGTVASLLRSAELARDDDAAGRLAAPVERPTD